MTLPDLLRALGPTAQAQANDGPAAGAEVSAVTYDSRQAIPGSVFVALRGGHADGASFGRDALARGAVVSAPVFKRIAEAALRHIGIGPTVNAPPPVLVARHDPQTDAMVPRPVGTPTTGAREPDPTPAGEMPDLRGLSAREALRMLSRIGLTPHINGDGFVIEQSPQAGAMLVRGDACLLKLGRRGASPAGGTSQ